MIDKWYSLLARWVKKKNQSDLHSKLILEKYNGIAIES